MIITEDLPFDDGLTAEDRKLVDPLLCNGGNPVAAGPDVA
jgi:hypothetical protein